MARVLAICLYRTVDALIARCVVEPVLRPEEGRLQSVNRAKIGRRFFLSATRLFFKMLVGKEVTAEIACQVIGAGWQCKEVSRGLAATEDLGLEQWCLR